MKAEELNKYTKEEIIYALGNQFDWVSEYLDDTTLTRMDADIKFRREQGIINKNEMLTEAWSSATDAYMSWWQEIFDKYGKDVNLADISKDDLERGERLEIDKNTLFEKIKRADSKLNKLYTSRGKV